MTMIKLDATHDPYQVRDLMRMLARMLRRAPAVYTGEWHAQSIPDIPQMATHELLDVTLSLPPMATAHEMASIIRPNLPWADKHFAERVGGIPVNPPPSHTEWPWARYNSKHQDTAQKFSHTYPERLWPKHAGNCHGAYGWAPAGLDGEHGDMVALDQYGHDGEQQICQGQRGIYYEYGDLNDLVELFIRSPLTRQGYLPIWFPEDTGAAAGQRVPCTLGYHFMVRNGEMSVRYYIRSCDFVRHFADDIYLTYRLLAWVVDNVNMGMTQYARQLDVVCPAFIRIGSVTAYISSLHAFVGDEAKLKEMSDG
jgi:hypothetical protein